MVLAKDINSLVMGGEKYSKNISGKVFKTNGSSLSNYQFKQYVGVGEIKPISDIKVAGVINYLDGSKEYIVSGKWIDSSGGPTSDNWQIIVTEDELKQLTK